MRRAPGVGWIRLVSRIVPRPRRERWRREWEAELVWAWRRRREEGRDSLAARTRLRIRALSSVADAIIERWEGTRMTGWFEELRVTVRSLLRRPGFTAVVVATLGLGIGATTAVFTLVDGILLRPLPYDDPDELLSIEHLGRDGQDELPVSSGLYLLYRDRAATLEGVALFNGTAANLVADGEPVRVLGQAVTPDFFSVLGVEAALGRVFDADEARPGGPEVVVLSDGLWRSRFGADPGIRGRTIEMSGLSRTVLGVMPPDFGHPDRTARFWIPLRIDEANAPLASFFAGGVARVEDGSSLEAVRTEIQGMLDSLEELYPQDGSAAFLADVNIAARIEPLKMALVGDVTTTLWILLGTVGFVLLIACANVANLLLVRAEGRQRELALRSAIGASRVEIFRTFFSESLVLAGCGAAAGLVVASSAVRLTERLIPTALPRAAEVGMDLRVLLFAFGLTAACALFFGLFPLARLGSTELADRLRDGGGGRGGTGSREQHRLRNALVVSQVALALVLLVGSGLMFRSFLALRAVDPGFRTTGAVTARVIVPETEIEGWEPTIGFWRELRDRIQRQPGVIAAGLGTSVPLSGGPVSFGGIEVEDHPRSSDELPIFARQPRAEPGWFEALGIDVLEGRAFRPGDGGDGVRAVVVSRAFAERWWPERSAVGRRVRLGNPEEAWWEIVGVVEDVRAEGLQEPVVETVYFPALVEVAGQYDVARGLDLVVATAAEPLALLPLLRRELRSLNPRIPLAAPRTIDGIVRGASARTSFTMAVLGAASGVALLLGLVGIYGVISYVVSQRTREIGVRMALGASGPSVRAMVVRQGLALAAVGVVLGLVGAICASRLLESLLYEVSATDPATYASVAAALVAVALLASWLPALRAASVDPSVALRAE